MNPPSAIEPCTDELTFFISISSRRYWKLPFQKSPKPLANVVSNPLISREDVKKIVELFLKSLNAQLIERGITLELDEDVKERIAQDGYDPAFGARPLKRTIQRLVEDPLSEEVLKGRFQEGGVIVVRLEADQAVFIDKRDLVKSVSDA